MNDEEVFQGEEAAAAAAAAVAAWLGHQAAAEGARRAGALSRPAAGSRRADGDARRRDGHAEAALRTLRRLLDGRVHHHRLHERHCHPDAGRRARRRRGAVVPDPGPARVRRDASGRRHSAHGVRAAVVPGGGARERARSDVRVRHEATRHPDRRLLGGRLQVGQGGHGAAHRVHDGAQEHRRMGVRRRPSAVHHQQGKFRNLATRISLSTNA